jgi:hypothetical protein
MGIGNSMEYLHLSDIQTPNQCHYQELNILKLLETSTMWSYVFIEMNRQNITLNNNELWPIMRTIMDLQSNVSFITNGVIIRVYPIPSLECLATKYIISYEVRGISIANEFIWPGELDNDIRGWLHQKNPQARLQIESIQFVTNAIP